ncbi:hypothetical protein M758_11G045900 [Ceratodon purpureus]|nr:hypothetical protein M758_11G045900 [Ceratodon purpureus]
MWPWPHCSSSTLCGWHATFGLARTKPAAYNWWHEHSLRLSLPPPWCSIVSSLAWVWYEESSLACRLIWIALLVRFGRITTCWYVATEFFKMSPDDPTVHYVLLKGRTIRKGGRVAAAY